MRGQSAMEYLMNYWWAVLLALIVGAVLWKLGIPGMGTELTSKGQMLQTSLSTTLSPIDGGSAVIIGNDVTFFTLSVENKGATPVELLPKSTAITVFERELPLIPASRILVLPAAGRMKLIAVLDEQLITPGQKVDFGVKMAYLDVETKTPHLEAYTLSANALNMLAPLELFAQASFNASVTDSFKVNGSVSNAEQTPLVIVALMEYEDGWSLFEPSTARVIPEGRSYTFSYTSSPFSEGDLDMDGDGSTEDEFLEGRYAVRVVATDEHGGFAVSQGLVQYNATSTLDTEPLQ